MSAKLRMSEKEWQDFAKKTGRDPVTGQKITGQRKTGKNKKDVKLPPVSEARKHIGETYDVASGMWIPTSEYNKMIDKDYQKYIKDIAAGKTVKTPNFFENTRLSGGQKRAIHEYEMKSREYEKIQESERKAAEKEAIARKKQNAYLAQQEFNKGIGNYQARDFTSHITSWTASQVIRKPFNRSGLRMEFVSRGYTDPTSGLPSADYKNRTTNLVKGRVRGTLDIGDSSKKASNSNLTPSVTPNLNYILGNPANSGIGSGNVIMPIAVMKFKKRGGKFKRDEWWL